MKQRPILFKGEMVRAILGGSKTQTRRICKNQIQMPSVTECPYGQVGDQLWIRECHSMLESSESGVDAAVRYWADGNPQSGDYTRPKPSIHMPRWASRITLEITNIRIERLNDISEEDAKNEGVVPCGGCRSGFQNLWESINGNDSWNINPWVLVIEFKRVI